MFPNKYGHGDRAILGHIFVRGSEIKPLSPYAIFFNLKTSMPTPLNVYHNDRVFGCSIYKVHRGHRSQKGSMRH